MKRERLAVETTDLVFRHPKADRAALDRLSLTVREGRITGLLGPNGAGKTTIVSVLCGLLRADAGEVRVFGEPGTRAGVRRTIGLCPQELAIYGSLSARENLALFGKLAGLHGADLRARVERCLETARLEDAGSKRAEAFSGGMQRRLNLAVALVHRPRLLVLDEPTVGVDLASRHAIFETLRELNQGGTTILYTTHYMEEVERLCDDVVVLDRGRVLTAGTTRAIVAGALNAHTFRLRVEHPEELAGALRSRNWKAHALDEATVELAGNDLPQLLDEIARLANAGTIAGCETFQPSLEERFLELTQRPGDAQEEHA